MSNPFNFGAPPGQAAPAPAAGPFGAPSPAQPQYAPPVAQPGFAPPGAPAPQYAPPGAPAPQYAPPAPPPPQQYAPPQAPMAGGSPFAGLAGTQTHAKGNYFDVATDKGPTTAVCRVKTVQMVQSHKNGPSIAINLEVVQSNNPNVPTGMEKGVAYPLAKVLITRPMLISFLAAILGYDKRNPEHLAIINSHVTQQSEQYMTAAISPQNPLAGMLILAASRAAKNKQNEDRTYTDFHPAPNAVPGQGIRG